MRRIVVIVVVVVEVECGAILNKLRCRNPRHLFFGELVGAENGDILRSRDRRSRLLGLASLGIPIHALNVAKMRCHILMTLDG